MKNFAYINADSIKSVVSHLGKSSLALAGGTDLLNLLKDYVVDVDSLVNVKDVESLVGIEVGGSGARIGAATKIADLLSHDGLRKSYPALTEALWEIGTPQIRNMGTLGGNLCARPRCWYFRRDGFDCLKRGGPACGALEGDNEFHAIFGTGQKCVMVHPSSAAPALIAYGAKARVSGPSGQREVPIEGFFTLPAANIYAENVLTPSEVLTDIVIPPNQGKSATYEVRHKESHDWPLALASVVLQLDGNTVSDARICLGAVAPIPWRVKEAEAVLKGKAVTDELAAEAGAKAVGAAKPLSQNNYKVQLTRTAVKRAIIAAATGRRV